MSKIEEALKKAELSRNSSLVKTTNNKDYSADGNKDVAISRYENDTVKFHSSTKEIALMECGEILENDELSELKIIFSEMDDNKTANTYRDLRTKLIQKGQGKNFIAMVTSCVEGNASSLASLNISAAFTFDESKTSLLVDCNLSNPQLDSIVTVDNQKGLTDYIEDESLDVESIMHKTGIKRLKLIPAGTVRETASEYFTSFRMRSLMEKLVSRYTDRYIFIDTAPVTESADTRILLELCDFVILIVPYGTTSKSKILEAVDAIGKDKLLGVIFNEKLTLPKFSLF